MNVVKWEPFRDITTMVDRFNRVFDEGFGIIPGAFLEEAFSDGTWIPKIDVYEIKDTLVVKADLPGIDKDKIKIEVKNGTLTIKGERSEEDKTEEHSAYRLERKFGSFLRSFPLPADADSDKIRAQYKDGVLQVSVPMTKGTMSKEIKVEIK